MEKKINKSAEKGLTSVSRNSSCFKTLKLGSLLELVTVMLDESRDDRLFEQSPCIQEPLRYFNSSSVFFFLKILREQSSIWKFSSTGQTAERRLFKGLSSTIEIDKNLMVLRHGKSTPVGKLSTMIRPPKFRVFSLRHEKNIEGKLT